jgi:2-iminobutanoate/2-iminopropanoate deaminase
MSLASSTSRATPSSQITCQRLPTAIWCTQRKSPMQRRDLNAPDAYAPVAAYTQAIEVSGAARTLYISGQIGQRIDGAIPDDIVEQSRLAWQNLEAQLKAAGMSFDNLVKVTTILPNPGDVAAARKARSKALGDRKPASTLIVGGLANPAWKIEIEGIAVA